MSDEVPMCQCNPRGPVHPWEPGEYCPTVRVVPREPDAEQLAPKKTEGKGTPMNIIRRPLRLPPVEPIKEPYGG